MSIDKHLDKIQEIRDGFDELIEDVCFDFETAVTSGEVISERSTNIVQMFTVLVSVNSLLEQLEDLRG